MIHDAHKHNITCRGALLFCLRVFLNKREKAKAGHVNFCVQMGEREGEGVGICVHAAKDRLRSNREKEMSSAPKAGATHSSLTTGTTSPRVRMKSSTLLRPPRCSSLCLPVHPPLRLYTLSPLPDSRTATPYSRSAGTRLPFPHPIIPRLSSLLSLPPSSILQARKKKQPIHLLPHTARNAFHRRECTP